MCSYNSLIWRPVKQTRHCWYISFASRWLNIPFRIHTVYLCFFWDFIYLFIFIFLCFPDANLIALHGKLHNLIKLCFSEVFFYFFYFFNLFFFYPFCSMRLISLHLESAQFTCVFLKLFIYVLPPWGLFDYIWNLNFFLWF